mmetsp:Transcript_19868/g.75100  ORF Transcript_19868/g.75100 Transcript_19868/m.75100 type:complete len:189 (-) Transcript_19868:576-1142(-)
MLAAQLVPLEDVLASPASFEPELASEHESIILPAALGRVKSLPILSKVASEERSRATASEYDDRRSAWKTVFVRRGLLYLHVPKAAGTAVERAVFVGECDTYLGPLHFTARQWRKDLGDEVFRSLFKFASVRNPFVRLVSAYEYNKKGGSNVYVDLLGQEYVQQVRSAESVALGEFTSPLLRRSHERE